MKSHKLGKRENSREVREAKESKGKSRKVPTEEASKPKTPNDLDLAIAERIHNRRPYQEISEELKVSPKTTSKVKKMMDDGTIKIAENGKAIYSKNSESIEIGPLPKPLQMEILGAAHLEGKSPQELIARLIRLDRKMRLKGLTLDQLDPAAEFIEKAYSRGWTIDPLIDVLTRLEDSGFSDLDEQAMGSLRDFLECSKKRNLNPEHIMKVAQKTEEDWKNINQGAYDRGYQHGVEHYRAWLVKLGVDAFKYSDIRIVRTFDRLMDSAQQKAMDDPSVPR